MCYEVAKRIRDNKKKESKLYSTISPPQLDKNTNPLNETNVEKIRRELYSKKKDVKKKTTI